MASPFNVFRRNQRVMMAVLTGLAMFAFIFFDPSLMRSGGGTSKVITVLIIAGVCALGGWFVGQRHGKSQDWASWAALAGAIAAFAFVWSNSQSDISVNTKVKGFTDDELRTMGQKRYQANQFVQRAVQLTRPKQPSQGFGPFDERSMLQFALAKQEAKRLGILLNDAAVNQFINDTTDDKLSISDFKKILRDVNLTQGDLFNILRGELEARLALEIQTPMYDLWTDFFQRSVRPKLPETPEEDWELFRKMNVKESLSVVALPVTSFLPKVEEPAEAELMAFFEARKGAMPGNDGQPGFFQPPRARLAYVAAEFVKFESQATVPTDDEVADYYEQHKARYQVQEIPDLPESDEPADAANPQNIQIDLPPLDDAEPKKESPESGKKPDEKNEQNKEEKKQEKKDGDSSSATGSPTIRLVSAVTEEKDEPAKPESAENAPADAAAETEAKPAAKDEEMSDESEEMAESKPEKSGKPAKEIRYRPLDDDLRSEIRETMLRDRAFELMGVAADKAQEFMNGLNYEFQSAEEARKPDVAKKISQKLKDYAKQHQLEYEETGLLSKLELQTKSSEKIGAAVLPSGGPQFQPVSVADEVFPRSGQQTPLFFPQRADSRLRERRYAWWKIEDQLQHAPEWTEEGIPEQVKEAWKYEKARQLAQTRAVQLMEQAKTEPENLSAALAGQTVTGELGTASVVIRETPRFSWLTTSMSTPPQDMEFSDFLAPRRSFIDGVDRPGDDFMKLVFESLNVGDVGVAPNIERSVFYLVKVVERDGTETESDIDGYQTLVDLRSQFLATQSDERRSFMSRPYNLMMMNAFFQLQQEWSKDFDKRYGVEFDNPEFLPTAGGPRRPRR